MEPIPKIRNAYQNLFNRWHWELHLTFHFANYVDFGIATKQVKQWIRFHKDTFKGIKYAGLLLLTKGYSGNTHVHVLLTSDQSYRRTLSDINPVSLKLIEHWWTKGSCKITTSKDWDNYTISRYLTKKKNLKLYNPDEWDLYYYRPNLLKKLCYQ
jgi:hypothetical protein